MVKFIDLAGSKFGLWTVLERSHGHRETMWLCRCSCGTEKVVRGADLKSGKSLSCSCLRAEMLSAMVTKHGMSESNEYKIWNKMLLRCSEPSTKGYANYGGRGIKVGESWHKFENFYADMGPRPSISHSIDRYPDNDGNYEPGNCRWATRVEQNNNTRRNRMIEFRGEVVSLSDAIRASGSTIGYGTIRKRVELGWDIETALTATIQGRSAA